MCQLSTLDPPRFDFGRCCQNEGQIPEPRDKRRPIPAHGAATLLVKSSDRLLQNISHSLFISS